MSWTAPRSAWAGPSSGRAPRRTASWPGGSATRASQLVHQLSGLLRMCRLHSLENRAFEKPLRDLARSLQGLIDAAGQPHPGPGRGPGLPERDPHPPGRAAGRFGAGRGAPPPRPGRAALLRARQRAGAAALRGLLRGEARRAGAARRPSRGPAGAKGSRGSSSSAASGFGRPGPPGPRTTGTLAALRPGRDRRLRQPRPRAIVQPPARPPRGRGAAGPRARARGPRRGDPRAAAPMWRTPCGSAGWPCSWGARSACADDLLQDVGVAALLHDVGYVATNARTAPPPPPWSATPPPGARLLLRQRGFHISKVRRARAVLGHHAPAERAPPAARAPGAPAARGRGLRHPRAAGRPLSIGGALAHDGCRGHRLRPGAAAGLRERARSLPGPGRGDRGSAGGSRSLRSSWPTCPTSRAARAGRTGRADLVRAPRGTGAQPEPSHPRRHPPSLAVPKAPGRASKAPSRKGCPFGSSTTPTSSGAPGTWSSSRRRSAATFISRTATWSRSRAAAPTTAWARCCAGGGLVSPAQLEGAAAEAARSGQPLGRTLVSHGDLDAEFLEQALAAQARVLVVEPGGVGRRPLPVRARRGTRSPRRTKAMRSRPTA